MKLWHDDCRRPPDDSWVWARTNDEAKKFLETGQVVEASLDHDLGLHEVDPDLPDADLYAGSAEDNGFMLVRWMCENDLIPPTITVHSWNPDGARRMAQLLRDAGCRAVVKPYSRPQLWEE